MPPSVTTPGDWVYLGSGAIPSSSNSFSADALISAQINSGDATLAGAFSFLGLHVGCFNCVGAWELLDRGRVWRS